MSDPLELEQVRAAVAARMESVSPERAARLRELDYRPRRRRATRLVPAVGAAATAFAAAVVAAVLLLLSGGTPVAFAGWTSAPAQPSTSSLNAARTACGRVPATGVIAAETRGPYTAIAFARDGKLLQCVAKGSHMVVKLSTLYPTRVYATAPPDKAMLPVITQQVFGTAAARLRALNADYQDLGEDGTNSYFERANALLAAIDATKSGPDSVSVAIGAAGTNVAGVTFILRDGDRVQATVEHGWYVAWWPGTAHPGGGTARRVAVTTAAGTKSSPLPTAPKLGTVTRNPKQCIVGDSCSVLVPLAVTPTLPAALTSDFSLFRDTPPAKTSNEPGIVRRVLGRLGGTGTLVGSPGFVTSQEQYGVSYGLDFKQVRGVKLGAGSSEWIVPGSEAVCTANVRHGGATASCGQLSGILQHGAIGSGSSTTAAGVSTYRIGGFVPDGNPTVTVHMASGAKRIIPVRHNSLAASFTSQPRSVTFKNAYGKTVTVRV